MCETCCRHSLVGPAGSRRNFVLGAAATIGLLLGKPAGAKENKAPPKPQNVLSPDAALERPDDLGLGGTEEWNLTQAERPGGGGRKAGVQIRRRGEDHRDQIVDLDAVPLQHRAHERLGPITDLIGET